MLPDQTQSRENIDAFSAIIILWKHRLTLLLFIGFAAAPAMLFVFSKKDRHFSDIHFQIAATPPFADQAETLRDVQRNFFNKSTFDLWSEKNNDSASQNKIGEGLYIGGRPDFYGTGPDDLFEFKPNKLTIFTNNKKVILASVNYLNFVNAVTAQQYVGLMQKEVERQEARIEQLANLSSTIELGDNPVIHLYLSKASTGNHLPLRIMRPTEPERIGSPKRLILIMALIAGVSLGSFFVLVRHAFRIYLAKADRLAKEQT